MLFALGIGSRLAAAVDAADAPSAIESALAARACSAVETPSTSFDAHLECVSAQLLSLRADFGRDLSRLSRKDRTSIDTVCSPLGTGEQRDAYLDCVRDRLVAVRNRQTGRNSAASEDTVAAPSLLPAASADALPPAEEASSWSAAVVVGGAVGMILAAAGATFLMRRRSRGSPHACRACGLDAPDSDLCASCRHEAALALRRSAAERADQQKSQEEDERRQREDEAEQQRAREELLRRQQAEEALRLSPAVEPVAPPAEFLKREPPEAAFDPYVVLGASPETGPDGIRLAYERAMTTFDPNLVSHLSDEVQAHFRARAESIERAYGMLAR